MPESALQKDVKNFIYQVGGIPIRVNSGTIIIKGETKDRAFRGAEPGTSDLICLIQGKFVAIETKVHPKEATDAQIRFLEEVAEKGGIGLLAFDLDFVVWFWNSFFRKHGIEGKYLKEYTHKRKDKNRLFWGSVEE